MTKDELNQILAGLRKSGEMRALAHKFADGKGAKGELLGDIVETEEFQRLGLASFSTALQQGYLIPPTEICGMLLTGIFIGYHLRRVEEEIRQLEALNAIKTDSSAT